MDALLERLAEEGCDDALVGVGQLGRLPKAAGPSGDPSLDERY